MYQLTNSDMEVLEQALNDQLSEEAFGALRKRLSEDPEFKAEAGQFLQTCAALQTVRRERWRAHLKQQTAVVQGRQKSAFTRRNWILAAAAAVLLIVAIVAFWPSSPTPQTAEVLAAREALDVPIWRGATMSEAGSSMLRQKAGMAYNAGQYRKAVGFLQSYFEEKPGPDADLELMLGVALLHAEQPAEALDVLTRRKANPAADPYETDWYRALSLLMLQRAEDARPLLKTLSDAPTPYQADAKKLTEKIF